MADLLDRGHSRAETARLLGLAKSTVTYHARNVGAPVDDRCARRYDWAAVQRYYDAGFSVRDCRVAFGFNNASWHAAVKRGAIVARPRELPLDELLVAGAYRGRENVKRRLLAAGLKDERCEGCGLTQWWGKPLSLALHHANGDRLDNRVENLQLLCPNCHSQTETWGGRNRRRGAGASERACS